MRAAGASLSIFLRACWKHGSRNPARIAFLSCSFLFATLRLGCPHAPLGTFGSYPLAQEFSRQAFFKSAWACVQFGLVMASLKQRSLFFSAVVVSAAAQAYIAFDSASASSVNSGGRFGAEEAIVPGSGYWCRSQVLW